LADSAALQFRSWRDVIVGFKFVVIRPRAYPTYKSFETAIVTSSYRLAVEAGKSLTDVAKDWQEPPTVEVKDVSRGAVKMWEVVATGEVFYYVNFGTKPHMIRPRRYRGWLRFRSDYVAKTRPGSLISRSGGARGRVVFAKYARHPGMEPRRFDLALAKQLKGRYPQLIHSSLEEMCRRLDP